MIVGDNQDHDFSQKMQRCQDYIDALHGERQKILVFQRELPLCLELVTQAIEACKQQLSETATATATAADCMHAQSECNSEQTTSDGPVFEEFIPIKRNSCSDDDDDEHESHKSKSDNEKSDWLGSAQLSLWNPSSDPPISPRKLPVTEVKRTGGGGSGAFHPFKREKSDRAIALPVPAPAPETEAVEVAATDAAVGKKKDDKDEHGQRKARRCWSPELHRRFLQALQQLGGSHVATPKQIRDLMKVDGLTNDEVKSHLQKYRLHTRRPTQSTHNSNNNNNNPQAPQFVVVGGIWVQPPEFAVSGDPSPAAATRNGVYAPIATPAVPRQRQQINQPRSSHSDERATASHSHDSNSPANSSSTHTTTAS
ncbi:transcription factor HHO3-like [Impatiens glandulifera]|uniref:transcription factor HHO3-like n=1 Tax=Impatiens glandulifera TaxID=253017 RepID=UPI001FB12E37|nr:transcription factor HHO3-like [Impatiens glandulifera]